MQELLLLLKDYILWRLNTNNNIEGWLHATGFRLQATGFRLLSSLMKTSMLFFNLIFKSAILKISTIPLIILASFFITSLIDMFHLAYSQPVVSTFPLMGTKVEIEILDKDKSSEYIQKSIDKAISLMKNLEFKFSKFEPKSELNRLNNSAGMEPIVVGDMMWELLNCAINWSKKTDGAFDITISPLVELWGFGTRRLTRFKIPPKEKIDKIKAYVGFDKIEFLDNQRIRLNSEKVKIDLSGIAKGFIVDKALEFLKEAGMENAIINAGGDIYCLGEGPSGEGWNIGIQHPRELSEIIAKINLKNKAIATSGDYRNFFFYKGRRYSHIIDPRTGYPVENSVISATVISLNCTDADALSTALLVLGKDKGLELINNLKDIEAIIICEDVKGNINIFISDGLKDNIKIFNQ